MVESSECKKIIKNKITRTNQVHIFSVTKLSH